MATSQLWDGGACCWRNSRRWVAHCQWVDLRQLSMLEATSWLGNLFRRDATQNRSGAPESHFFTCQMASVSAALPALQYMRKMKAPFTEVRGSFTFKNWIDQCCLTIPLASCSSFNVLQGIPIILKVLFRGWETRISRWPHGNATSSSMR